MRRRWIYDHITGACTEVSEDYAPKQRDHRYLPDLDSFYGGGFKSPINGEFITSRSQLRAHESRYECKQAGDFKRNELVSRENQRVQRIRDVAKQGNPLKWM